jgi:hypothetical protein
MKACLEKTEASHEEEEANQEKGEAVAQHQEVPNEEAAVEMIRALEDLSGDQQLAM